MRQSGKKPGSTRVRMEVLEPRVLYSADPFLAPLLDSMGPTPNDQSPAIEDPFAHQQREHGSTTTTELVIVDISYPELAELSQTLQDQYAGTGTKIVMLNGDSDAFAQISALLDSHSHLDAIHLLSHGTDGKLNLGGQSIGIEHVQRNASTVAAWGDSLTDTGDLLLYGCNLSATTQGQELASSLSLLMQADVASSDDITGHRDLGGDWDLEVEFGDLETPQLLTQQQQDDWTAKLDINSDLVARYELNGDFQDSVGNAHATAHDAPSLVPGQIAEAVSFVQAVPGTAPHLIVPAADTPDYNNGGFTLAFWVRPEVLTQVTIVDQSDATGGFAVTMSAAGRIRFELTQSTGGTLVLSANELMNADDWSHVAVTYTPGDMRVFVNGNEAVLSLGSSAFNDANVDLYFGQAGDGSDHFSGDLDDIRFYQRALTPTDVNELGAYTGGAAPNTEENLNVNTGATLLNGESKTIDSAILNATDAEQSAVDLIYTINSHAPGFSFFLDGVLLGTDATFTQQDIDDGLVGISHDGGVGASNTIAMSLDDGFDGNTLFNFAVSAEPNLAPTNIVLVSSENDIGLSVNENGGNAAYFKIEDAGEIFGDLNELTYEITFNTATVNPADFTVVDYFAAGSSQFKVDLLPSTGLLVRIGNDAWLVNEPEALSLADMQEHTLSLSWDASTGATSLYIDGVLIDSTTLAAGFTLAANGIATLGNDTDANTSASFTGAMHDMRIFNYTRSPSQIEENQSTQFGHNEEGLIGYWTFDSLTSNSQVGSEVGKHHLSLLQSTHPGAAIGQAQLQNAAVNENAAIGTVVATVQGIDPEREILLNQLLAANPDLYYSEAAGIFLLRGDGRISWDDAYAAASNMTLNGVNGHLAMPNSAVENTLLLHAINDQNLGRTWLSAGDFDNEGVYVIVKPGAADRQFADAMGNSVNGAYVNWNPKEPNSGNQFEDRVEIWNDTGSWNDIQPFKNNGNFFFAEFLVEEVLDGALGSNSVQRNLNYSITAQTIPGAFTIDASSGEIIVADGTLLDHETLGAHTVTVLVSDSAGNTISKDFSIDVIDIDDASVHLTPLTQTVPEDMTITFSAANGNGVSVQDVDDSEVLTLTLTSTNGLMNLNLAGSPNVSSTGSMTNTNSIVITGAVAAINQALDGMTYQPAADYFGTADISMSSVRSVQYGEAGTITTDSTIDIIVTPVQDNPVAVNDSVAVVEGGIATVVLSGDGSLLDNDTDADPSPAFTVISNTLPANGVVTVNANGTFIYTHDGGETSTDFFDYTIEDTVTGVTSTARVNIAVARVNDAPTPSDDVIQLSEGGTVSVTSSGANSLLTNDTDPDGDLIEVAGFSGSTNSSSITVNSDGSFTYVHDGSETTTDAFTYIVIDQHGATRTALVNVSIIPVNDTPVAVDDTVSVDEGGSATFNVHANDIDADANGVLFATVFSGPSNGSVVTNSNGTLLYTHDGSENLTDSFTYFTTDVNGANSDIATVSVVVNPVNDIPVAVSDSLVVNESATLTLDVLANDYDADGDALTVALVSAPGNGSVVVNGDNTVTYVHNGTETLSDSFVYSIDDGNGGVVATTVNVTVTPVNDAPVAVSDALLVNEGGSSTVDLLGNDGDAENDALTSIIVSQPSNGVITQNPDGTYTYTHDGLETLSDSFTYQAVDTSSATSAVTVVTIDIAPFNDDPVAVNDVASVSEAATFDIPVLLNDTDAELDNLTVSIATAPTNGAASVNADNTISYTHDGSETQSDAFTYTISDGQGGIDTATVVINILAVNDAPDAVADSGSVDEGGVVIVDVTSNDTDAEGNALSPSVVNAPVSGSLTLNGDGTYTYIHDGSETLNDSFTYIVTDDQGAVSMSAVVSLSINPVNDAPVAVNDTVSVVEGGSVIIDVHSNDSDAESNGALSASIVSAPVNGNLVANADGTFSYTHNGSENVSDSFAYITTDIDGSSSNVAIVNIVVSPVNDIPLAVNDNVVVNESSVLTIGVLANDSDADGDALSVSLVTAPGNGTAVVNVDNTITYTHNGSETLSDSFDYSVNDGNGGVVTATVNVTVTPVNDAPMARDDTVLVIEGGSGTVDLLINDTDAENNALTVVIVSQPGNGLISQNADGSFTYTHDGSETISDSFTYQAIDTGATTSQITTVSIVITPQNDDPVALNDVATVSEAGMLDIPVLLNDSDAEMDHLTVSIASSPHNGTAIVNADNAISYLHNGSETTSDTLTYIVSDGNGGIATAQVSINIVNVNDAPIAVDDAAVVDEGGVVSINAVLNDTDAESSALTPSIVSAPVAGVVAVNADGTFTYTHDGSETLSDSFTYTVTDAQGAASMSALVSLSINPVNDAPVAADDATVVVEGGAVVINVQANDTDAEGSALQTVINTYPQNGSLTVNSDGSMTYLHNGSENNTDHFQYVVIDDQGEASIADVQIAVALVNENAPVFLNEPISFQVSENASIGQLLGAVTTSDQDTDDAVSYSLSDNAGGRFQIDANGTVRVLDGALLNYEDSTSHTMIIVATDLSGNSSTAQVLVEVLNVLEPMTEFNSTGPFTVPENLPGPVVVGLVSASSGDDSGLISYSLSGPHSANFAINASNGEVTSASGVTFNHEAQPTYAVTVTAVDATGTQITEDVEISVVNVNEAPLFIAQSTDNSVSEMVSEGDSAGSVLAMDPDGDVLQYSIASGSVSSAFGINSQTGVLIVTDPEQIDFETLDQHALLVAATDPFGLSDVLPVSINIENIDEAPALNQFGGTLEYQENAESILIADGAIIADVDSPRLVKVELVIVNYDPLEDRLIAVNSESVDTAFDISTGRLLLTGPATVAEFNSVLQQVRYANIGENPNTEVRQIEILMQDASNSVSSAMVKIQVVADPTAVVAEPVQPEPIEPEPVVAPPDLGAALPVEQAEINFQPIEPVSVSSVLSTATPQPTFSETASASSEEQSESGEAVNNVLAMLQSGDDVGHIESDLPVGAIAWPEVDLAVSSIDLKASVNPIVANDIKSIHREIKLEAIAAEEQLASILSLNPLDVKLEEGARILWQVENAGLESSLNELTKELSESVEKSRVSSGSTEALVGVSVGITSGFLVWMLRSGALLASMFSVSPLWRQLDPLPIVDTTSGSDDETRDQDDKEIENLFDQMKG